MYYKENWYYGQITLIGTDSATKTLEYELGEAGVGFGETEAADALNQIRSGLVACTDANVAQTSLRRIYETDATLPTDADIFEVALVNVHINATGTKAKYHTLRIPAPSQGIFKGTTGVEKNLVDSADADLVNYVQQIAQHAYVSDGEEVNESEGYNGISQSNPGKRDTTKIR